MNKKALIAVVLGLILAISAGVFVLAKRSSNSSNPKMTDENFTTESQSQGTSAGNTLRQLLGTGVSQTCTYSDTDLGASGTIFVKDGKMRGDFEYNSEGNVISSYTIIDSETMYVWTEGQTDGFKIALNQTAADESASDQNPSPLTSESMDLDKQIDYNCSAWSGDSSKFELPSDIDFKDVSEMTESVTGIMENLQSGDDEGSTVDRCQYCDSLPDESKPQCLQAFGC
jgi:hypothetical protein